MSSHVRGQQLGVLLDAGGLALGEPGRQQPSYDKQYVRDWLTSPASGWDKGSGEAPAARVIGRGRGRSGLLRRRPPP